MNFKNMKPYSKIALITAGLLLATSCEVNDPFADKMELGQVLPTTSWELSSTVCKAGDEAGFLAKYYTTSDVAQIDHSEVWGMITGADVAAATQKLISSPAYTMTINKNDTVRGYHMLRSYPHSMAQKVGTEFHLNASFPTSSTLSPINWNSPADWDQEKFDMYYPADFQANFCEKMVNYLTADSTYLSGLRQVYINYPFTKEQIDAVNAKYPSLTPIPFSDSEETGKTKGDLWFSPDTKVIDHYYYTTLSGEVTVEHEIAKKEDAPSNIDPSKVYPVYKAPHWIFCRYSDNTGGAVTSVRAEYMPLWKELVQAVPFTAWIYDATNKVYNVAFSRTYTIRPKFRVIDTNGKVGTDTESKSIELN